MQIIFWSGAKSLGTAQYLNKFCSDTKGCLEAHCPIFSFFAPRNIFCFEISTFIRKANTKPKVLEGIIPKISKNMRGKIPT